MKKPLRKKAYEVTVELKIIGVVRAFGYEHHGAAGSVAGMDFDEVKKKLKDDSKTFSVNEVRKGKKLLHNYKADREKNSE